MQSLNYLREQTGELHRRLESGPLPKTLMSEKVEARCYAAFLRANYRVFAALEPEVAERLAAINDGALRFEKHRLIAKDLAALGEEEILNPPSVAFIIDEPSAWGAAYVLEGSALGGKVILKHLQNFERMRSLNAFAYLSGEGVEKTRWPAFKQLLEDRLQGAPKKLEAAASAAIETFLLMEYAFSEEAKAAGISA